MARSASYRSAGVNIDAGNELVRRIQPLAARTRRPEVVGGVGGFAALFRLPRRYRRPLLVASTDGVGTKLRLAIDLRRHDTVGIDLVAMSANDVLTLGAEPLAFLDYFATSRLRPSVAAEVVKGIAAGCREARCALIGGETAELPSFYANGDYDLAGFVIGVVEEDRVVDGRSVRPGDAVIGLASNGLHSNGFALVRNVLLERAKLSLRSRPPELRQPLGRVLLTPTRIYVRTVLALRKRHAIKAMAHITGGGILENLPRVLPRGCGAVIEKGSWTVPPIFRLIQRAGNIVEKEMYRTFNMGVGFILVVGRRERDAVMAALARLGEDASVIGEVRAGPRKVRLVTGRATHAGR